jgi:hypothetical protein
MKIYTITEFEELFNKSRTGKHRVKKTYPMTKRKLTKAAVKETVIDGNGIPSHRIISPAKYVDAPNTNKFQELLVDYMKTVWGAAARRISSEGRWRREKNHPEGGRFIKGLNNGMEDVQAIYKGRTIALEAKFTKSDRVRAAQRKRRDEVESAGGLYLVCKSFEQVQRDLITHFFIRKLS